MWKKRIGVVSTAREDPALLKQRAQGLGHADLSWELVFLHRLLRTTQPQTQPEPFPKDTKEGAKSPEAGVGFKQVFGRGGGRSRARGPRRW